MRLRRSKILCMPGRFRIKLLILAMLFSLGTGVNTLSASVRSDVLIGTWENSTGHIRVEIYKKGHLFYGTLVWLKNPYHNGKPKTDWKNPDPALRNRQIIGLVIIRGFIYEGNYVWDSGKVYDPDSGNDYSCKLQLINKNSLEVRGFIGITFIGRTEIWTRVSK